MTNTFSTLKRSMESGRVYSSHYGRAVQTRSRPGGAGPEQRQGAEPGKAPGFGLGREAPVRGQGPVAPEIGARVGGSRWTFYLSGEHLPEPGLRLPGTSAVVRVERRPDAPLRVAGELVGLQPPADPAVQPVLWLIHDLPVPPDLAEADLARLPRGQSGTGNRRGDRFTLDGNPPTYGRHANTLAIAISPGRFTAGPDGVWRLEGAIDAGTNQAFHPLVVLGPAALADIDAPVPTGVVARTLTDLFMRPVTVRSDLSLQAHFPQRLVTLFQQAETDPGTPRFVDGSRFTRAAVTLEGLVRGTPRLMPTRQTCFLIAMDRQSG